MPAQRFRTYHEVEGPDRSGVLAQVAAQRERVANRLATVGRVVAVTSGKGGVGKSFVTARLAQTLARTGQRVGVMDADVNGPTIPRLLTLATPPSPAADGIVPGKTSEGIAVFSMAFLLEEGAPLKWRGPAEDAFVWRGSLEVGAIRELLADVVWGDLDVLLVDLPPGAARLLDLHGLVPEMAGVLAVTIPSDESLDAVRRALILARERGISILGIVENMATMRCPSCGEQHALFVGAAGATLAEAFSVEPAMILPFHPREEDFAIVAQRLDEGKTG